jgi:AsmA protein
MNKPLRLGLKIFAALILLLLIVGISLPFIIDPNDYKDEIISRVKQETGRELAIPGDISLSVFPWLGVQLGEVSFGNAPGFGDQPMARINAVDVRVKLLPLLQKEVQIAHVTLDGFALDLHRNSKGQTNWDDLVRKEEPTKPIKPDTEEKESRPRGAALAALAVDGFSLTNSRLDWTDAQAKQHFTLNDIELSLGAVALDQAFPLKTSLIFSSRQPEANGTLTLATEITVAANLRQVSLKNLKLETQLNSAAFAKPLPPVTVQLASLALDLGKESLQGNKLRVTAYNVNLQGDISAQKILSTPSYQGQLKVPPFSLRQLLTQLGIELPATADAKVLQHVELLSHFQGTSKQLKLDKLHLKLDDSTLTGNAVLPRLGKPALQYTLALDTIDADRYLPPPTETKAAKAKPAPSGSSAAAAATQLPLDLLRTLDINGRLKIDHFKISNLRASKIFLPTTAKQGIIQLSPISAKLYDGSYQGNISLNVQQDTPRLGINESLKNVNIGPLLKDFWGDDKIRGKANLNAKLTARGMDPVAFRKTLNGTARFEFLDGAIKGFNLAQMERDLKARLKGQPVSKEKVPLETDFASITGSLTATSGLVQNKDLQAAMPYARAIGAGKAYLVSEELDYTLKVKFTSKAIGQSGRSYAEMDKVPLPIRIRGTFSQPRFEPDYDAVIKALAKQRIEEEKQQLEEKAKKKIEKEVGDELKKLFKY